MISFLRQFEERVDCRFLGKNDDREIVDPYVRLHQVHGNTTIVARQPMLSTEQADGVITDAVGLPLAIRAADCQNFAVYAPEAHVGGVLHAGWSGMIQEAKLSLEWMLEIATWQLGHHYAWSVPSTKIQSLNSAKRWTRNT